MEKTKLLTITVIGLLLINLGTLGFLFLKDHTAFKPRHDDRPMPREIIIEKLHFDVGQQKEYDKLISIHQSEISALDENIRNTKNKLYSQLSQNEVRVKFKDSLINLLNSYQKQIEETHFKHFESIKKLCHQDQMSEFKNLTDELGRIFSPKPRMPRHE